MNWKVLNNPAQIEEIISLSETTPVMIFKHSTRCSISSMALDRFKRNWKEEDTNKLTPYYLDLIAYRDISNSVASKFAVDHESPQVILIKDGKAFFDQSHMGISYAEVMRQV
ncbi:bacillithiol system redox-active protein YtxJ [Belliella kenyensis]|uniref:Bacillithiol system redox-active protein YtxJ n=1 Tax=Belliella kenyensis TaxID=1472724 RepID=A0ABV8EQC0_9BACT|nr:bacillithiol system redox-active protein YtxJ [Belliella kenyensis]MCH7401617.1 bacillithiol system redox-active protein YtxJ [Belliella kenyensis]MDN3603104.1 bacillithiol system redox-active protein YtxJ [Belliella kenyensis]